MRVGLRHFGVGPGRVVAVTDAKDILVTVDGWGLCAISDLGSINDEQQRTLEASATTVISSLTGEVELLIVPLATLRELELVSETILDKDTPCAVLVRLEDEDVWHVYEISLMFE